MRFGSLGVFVLWISLVGSDSLLCYENWRGRIQKKALSFNDLWKYDTVTNIWTWMHGSDQPNQNGGLQNIRMKETDTHSLFWLLLFV
jgi:hypothetical protein